MGRRGKSPTAQLTAVQCNISAYRGLVYSWLRILRQFSCDTRESCGGGDVITVNGEAGGYIQCLLHHAYQEE